MVTLFSEEAEIGDSITPIAPTLASRSVSGQYLTHLRTNPFPRNRVGKMEEVNIFGERQDL